MIWEISLVNIMKCLLWAFAVSWNGSMSGHIPVRWQGLRDIPTRTETTESTEFNRHYFDQLFMSQRNCLGQEESSVPFARKGDRRSADLPQTTKAWRVWNRDLKKIHRETCVGEGGICVKGEGRLGFFLCQWQRALRNMLRGAWTRDTAWLSLWWSEHTNPGTLELTTEAGCVLGLWQQGEENWRCWSKLTTE